MATADQMYLDTLAGYQARENAYKGNYTDNIAGYERLYRTQGQYGESERQRLNQDFARQLSSSQASMVSRGLGNTTVLDSAARGINYDRALASLTLNDQLLQRQNQIAQQELQYAGQYQQGLAGLQGERLGYMGTAQQNTQAQNFQAGMNTQQFGQQKELGQQNFQYQQEAARQGFQYQSMLANQAFNNQVSYQDRFGFYNKGGIVPGYGNRDTHLAMTTPGEMILSKEMIAALESGQLDRTGLVDIIRRERMKVGQPPIGGYVG